MITLVSIVHFVLKYLYRKFFYFSCTNGLVPIFEKNKKIVYADNRYDYLILFSNGHELIVECINTIRKLPLKFNDNIILKVYISGKSFNIKQKTFNTIFFPEKEELISLLDRFKQSKLYLRNLIPNNFGIMLFGCSGTGKTSLIACIAHHLKLSCNIINACKINTIEPIKNSILSNTITVFNEFDYMIEKIICGNTSQLELELSSLKVQMESAVD